MKGVRGSSSSKATYDTKHSCVDAEELLKSFYKNNKNLFRKGFDINKASEYVEQAEKEISKLLKNRAFTPNGNYVNTCRLKKETNNNSFDVAGAIANKLQNKR